MLFVREPRTVNLFGLELPEPRILLDFLGFETHVKQIRARRGAAMPPLWYDHASYYIVDLTPEKLFGAGEDVDLPQFVNAADYELVSVPGFCRRAPCALMTVGFSICP